MGKGTGMSQNRNVFNVPWTVFEWLFQNLDIFCHFSMPKRSCKRWLRQKFFNGSKSILKQGWVCLDKFIFPYQGGWIGTVEVNRDSGLEPGETFFSTVPIHPVWWYFISISHGTLVCPLRTIGDPQGPLGGPSVPENSKQNASNNQISLCPPLKWVTLSIP